MKSLSNRNLARGFDQFIFENYDQSLPIFEASFLSQLGLPDDLTGLIKKIHKKKEHTSERYPRMGSMYKQGTPIGMPYKYYRPAGMSRSDINKFKREQKEKKRLEAEGIEYEMNLPSTAILPKPVKLTGAYSYESPFEDRDNRKSAYKDIAWYLISLRSGEPLRVLLTDEKKSAFFYIYAKSLSAQNIPGDQFALVVSFKDESGKWNTVDTGFGEMVTFGAAMQAVGKRHESKGGNTNQKVQEFIKFFTGGKQGGPSKKNPIYAYNLAIMQPGRPEPREIRQIRSEKLGLEGAKSSIPVIEKFTDKYFDYLINNESIQASFISSFNKTMNSLSSFPDPTKVPEKVAKLADALGLKKNELFIFLFVKMRDFREVLLKEGRGSYTPTPGEDLEDDNLYLTTKMGFNSVKYKVEIKLIDPDEIEGVRREEEFIKAKPEYAKPQPQPGDYASIHSMIKSDSEMGVLGNFMNYIITGSIRNMDTDAAIARMNALTRSEYLFGDFDFEF